MNQHKNVGWNLQALEVLGFALKHAAPEKIPQVLAEALVTVSSVTCPGYARRSQDALIFGAMRKAIWGDKSNQ